MHGQSVQQDAISKCGHLERHHIGTCEMQAREEGPGTISTNAIGGFSIRLGCFLWGCWMNVRVWLHLKRAHMYITGSFKVVWSQMSLGGSSLVDMYAKCGSLEDAWRVFNKMPSWDVVTWSAMILGHVKYGQGQKALELYWQIQQHGVQPNSVTFVGVPNACASLIALEEGRCVHHHSTQSGLEMNPYFGTGCSLGLTYHNGSLL
jgi:pentatricopeptide repeat protein